MAELLPTMAPDGRDVLAKELVVVFDVNRIVADIRIGELFPETTDHLASYKMFDLYYL